MATPSFAPHQYLLLPRGSRLRVLPGPDGPFLSGRFALLTFVTFVVVVSFVVVPLVVVSLLIVSLLIVSLVVVVLSLLAFFFAPPSLRTESSI